MTESESARSARNQTARSRILPAARHSIFLQIFAATLLFAIPLAQAADAEPLPVCGGAAFNDVLLLCGMAGVGMAALLAIVYMAGEAMQNARMLTWAKSEVWELFFSLFVAAIILFSLAAFCNMQVGEAGTLSSSLPRIYQGNEGKNLYDGSLMYLENLAGFGLRNIAQLRSNLGAYEIRTSFQRYNCDALCFITMTSYTEATYSGESIDLAVTNNLLGVATVSYLSALFQYFTLQYIVSGLFVAFLPLAIVLRSIPFMRNFGGALVGIIIALYVMYPLAQISSAIVAPYLAKGLGSATIYNFDESGCAGVDVFVEPSGHNAISCDAPMYSERDIGGRGIFEDLPEATPIQDSIKINALMFLAAVFLPALYFIVLAALARDISGVLGDEADVSRLGQMI